MNDRGAKIFSLNSVAAMVAALAPRVAMLIIGVVSIRILGVEEYGLFTLALTTGLLLGQFIPDTISAYFATKGRSSQEPRNNQLQSTITQAVLLSLKMSVLVVVTVLLIANFLEPFLNNARLQMCTYIFALAFPFACIAQILNSQFAVNGYEKRLSIQAIMVACIQLVFGFGGCYFWGVIGLSTGLFVATIFSVSLSVAIYCSQFDIKHIHQISIKIANSSNKLNFPPGIIRLSLSLALGAPVHWLVLRTLGEGDGGLYQVGQFSYAYYFYTLMILVPSSMQSYIIGKLSQHIEIMRNVDSPLANLASIFRLISIVTIIFACCLAIFHFFASPVILKTTRNTLLAPGFFGIIVGFFGVMAVLASQYLIASGDYVWQLRGTFLSAVIYVCLAYCFIVILGLGASGALIALGLAQIIQVLFISRLILIGARAA